ncbi:bifunctional riboflavin kinase/FAD synthetase [candidate division GN15 bacterium]|nr:bifunctional riboflavin kinase/FAD synthetase [candidate division GN15 bacterium]
MTTHFIRGLNRFVRTNGNGAVATLGTFDGIHRGHQEILCRVRDHSMRHNLEPVLITFHPHPRVVVTPNDPPMLLTSIEEKEKFVPDFLDGHVLVLEFNDELRSWSAEEFVKKVIVDTVGAKRVIVGYDHHFGKDRSGSIDSLREFGERYGFEVEVVQPVIVDGHPVSSSRIRRALKEERFDEAIKLLGHEYAIYGTVERGIGLGRKIGYPTANVCYSTRKLLPTEGVYACWVEVAGQSHCGMMFIGQNHFNPAERVTVEANIFDFDRDIYDEEIVVYPVRYVRGNHKYDSTEALVAQIEKDKEQVLNILSEGERRCL